MIQMPVCVCRGDIFYISHGDHIGSEQMCGRPGVVVSNNIGNEHSPNVEVVPLTTQPKKPLPTHVSVLAKVPSIALCENIQTVSKERLGDFIRICTDSEMKEIDNALRCSLGLDTSVTTEENEVRRFVSEAELECKFYKTLYEQLLDRLTEKALVQEVK